MWGLTAYTTKGILGGQVNTILGTLLLSSVALGACLLIIKVSLAAEREAISISSELVYQDLL